MSDLVVILAWNSGLALVVGGIGWAVWRTMRSSSLAHALYLLAAIKLVTPPVFLVDAPIWRAVEPVVGEATPAQPSPSPELALDTRSSAEAVSGLRPVIAPVDPSQAGAPMPTPAEIAGALWALGALIVLAVALRRMYRLRRLLAHADVAPPRVRELASEVCATLKISRVPRICIVDARLSPSLCAIGRRPVVVLPGNLLRQFEDHELLAVLTHELSHLAGRDHLTRWLELLVGAVHWWNPIALWLRRGMREVEEIRCDARAVEALAWHPRRYGRVILKAACVLQAQPVPFAAAGLGEVDSLKRRMQMMSNGKLRHGLNWPIRLALLGSAGTLLPLGVQAQERHEEVRVEVKKDAGEIADLVKKLVRKVKQQDKSEKSHADDIREKVEKALRKVEKHDSTDDLDDLGEQIGKAVRGAIEKAIAAHGGSGAFDKHGQSLRKLLEESGHAPSDLAKAIRDAIGQGAEVKVIGPYTKSFTVRDFKDIPETVQKAIKKAMKHFDFKDGGDFAKAVKKSVGDHVGVEVLGPFVDSYSVGAPPELVKKLRKALEDQDIDVLDDAKLSESIKKALREAMRPTHNSSKLPHDIAEKLRKALEGKAQPRRRAPESAKTKELLEQLEQLKAQIRDLERKLRR